ncbi:MAG: UDP-N-acetylmuramoyl-L-alanine--D-glutamate ligase [Tissierellales bacterium]|jgi:UDP-N-acetylmuramoylalanine--D-glutamate ligase|nr:UDP-N-acetylmuramoyl-L-alanine--D-glutamate ligase [Tissierellales bacterium]
MIELKGKRALVLGLGVSGVSAVKALDKLGASVVVSDSKDIDELQEYTEQLKDLKIGFCLGSNNALHGIFDFVIKSPGIPLDIPILDMARERGVEIMTDIELVDRLFPNKIVAITGTNGKTTTTCLTGEMIEAQGIETHIMGNVGVGALWEATQRQDDDDVFVIEASSFQLESTTEFKPDVGVILNFSPDHLSWHGSYEAYISAKSKMLERQTEEDFAVLNYDDDDVRKLGEKVKSKVIYFSQKTPIQNGIYLSGDFIIYNNGESDTEIVNVKNLNIVGNHNYQNAMAAAGIAVALGLDFDLVRKSFEQFNAVEHRLEFVKEIDGVSFYNDSKGTNPDSSIKALEAMKSSTILIAGGYDKGSEFDDYIKAFDGKVKHMFVMGETADQIIRTAEKYNFNEYSRVENMDEAVEKAWNIAENSDIVLLSPACASWGMYDNYEQRGKHFKKLVENLR